MKNSRTIVWVGACSISRLIRKRSSWIVSRSTLISTSSQLEGLWLSASGRGEFPLKVIGGLAQSTCDLLHILLVVLVGPLVRKVADLANGVECSPCSAFSQPDEFLALLRHVWLHVFPQKNVSNPRISFNMCCEFPDEFRSVLEGIVCDSVS